MIHEAGIYMPDGEFHSKQQIMTDLATRQTESQPVIYHTPVMGGERSFAQWTQILYQRSQERKEAFELPTHVSIEIPSEVPVNLVWFGDTHAGAEDCDYQRIKRDVDYIRDTPNTYVVTLGDMTDSFFWNPAQMEEIGNAKEQHEWLLSALREMKGKLLAGFIGDHDQWASKIGITSYQNFRQEFNAHVMHGAGYISLKVGKVDYRIVATHRAGGSSIYNNAHPAQRFHRETGSQADIAVVAHTHRKGYNSQTVKDWGGEARTIHYLVVGPYKNSDEYARKNGWPRQTDEDMGGMVTVLDPNTKNIQVKWRIT